MAHQLRDVLQALATLYQPGAVGVPEGVPDPLGVIGVAQEGPLALPVLVQGVRVEGEQAPGPHWEAVPSVEDVLRNEPKLLTMAQASGA